MVQNKFKLVRPYPNREIGDIVIYDPEINAESFMWEKDKTSVPKEFQPDLTLDWFEEIPLKNYVIESEYSEIKEVRRFLDNKVFKVGDDTNNGVIERFRESGTHMRVHFVGKNKNHHMSINTLKKIERPLFKTEDGVDIFDGDVFYFLVSDYPSNKKSRQEFKTVIARKDNINAELAFKRFADEEAIKEYMSMDAEVFSLRDIATVYSTANYRSSNTSNAHDGWSRQAFKLRSILEKKLKNK